MNADNDKQTAAIGQGKPGPGRPAGSANRTTKVLKEAILLAAENVGEDGKGEGGLEGYLTMLARTEPKTYAGLLGRVLPLQVTGDGGGPVRIVATSDDESL